jgi:non-ribosomal peptide synthetase component F
MMNGGTLHIRGSGDENWKDCLQRVDTVIATPSVVLKQMPDRREFPRVRTIAVGGEPCPLALAEKWAPYVRFWNVCGPTEISVLNQRLHPRREREAGQDWRAGCHVGWRLRHLQGLSQPP